MSNNRVTKRYGLIGKHKELLSRAFSQSVLPVECDAAIPTLVANNLLIEAEEGYASLSKHLRAIGEDGLERHSRFEAPEQFIGLLDSLTALARDYVAKTERLADTRDVEERFRNQCSALYESIERSLQIFREQTENVDAATMTMDEAERHFAFYQKQITDYLAILQSLTGGELVDTLNEPLAQRLDQVFARIIHARMSPWISLMRYLLNTINQALAKLRHSARKTRRLRAVVAHLQRNPDFLLEDPLGGVPAWVRLLAPSTPEAAIDWTAEDVLAMGPMLMAALRNRSNLPARKERTAGELISSDDEVITPLEPPAILKAMTEWIEAVGPAGVSAMAFYETSPHLTEIPRAMWLLALHTELEYAEGVTWSTRPSWAQSDDKCLLDARFSASAA